MTRNIEKNKGTQVNSRTIGVLVHPAQYPPVVTTDDIVVNYTYDTVTSSVIIGGPGHNGIEESNGGVYVNTLESVVVDGDTYYKFNHFEGGIYGDIPLYSKDTDSVQYGTSLYSIEGEQGSEVVTLTTTGKSQFYVQGTLIKNTPDSYLNTNYEVSFEVSGNYVIDSTTGYKVGYITSSDSHTDENVTFVKGSKSGDLRTWVNTSYVSSGFGDRTLYTSSDDPAVGDDALFSEDYDEFNVQEIIDVDTTTTPVPPDPVECTVSYSVDGSSWTDHPTVLTDTNNVIVNIPKYMYLKFSQDVEITEE